MVAASLVRTWNTLSTSGVSTIPPPLPVSAWLRLYNKFDAFVEAVAKLPREHRLAFDEAAASWRTESGLRFHYSGYFSPYYRDRVGETGKDQKQILQSCIPYYSYLSEHHPHLLAMPEFETLLNGLHAALASIYADCLPFVHALREFAPALSDALLSRDTMPPVVLRLLRYEASCQFLTHPHVDKSAITIIAHTDDPPDDPCLVFAPRVSDHPLPLSAFAPAGSSDQALMFMGAAPQQAGLSRFSAAPHAVRPVREKRVRHSAVFFWLLPGIDLHPFSTHVPFVDDLAALEGGRGLNE